MKKFFTLILLTTCMSGCHTYEGERSCIVQCPGAVIRMSNGDESCTGFTKANSYMCPDWRVYLSECAQPGTVE